MNANHILPYKLFALCHILSVIIALNSNKYDDLAQNSQKQAVPIDIAKASYSLIICTDKDISNA